jgi:hypothetical protein
VAEFKYFGKTLTNQNYIDEEVKIKLAQCLTPFSSEYFIFSSTVSVNLQMEIYKTIVLYRFRA